MDKTVHTFEHNDVPVSHVPVNICLLYHDSLCNIRWGKISPEPGGAGRMGGRAEMAGRNSRDGEPGWPGGRDNPDGISSVGNGTVYNRMCTRWRHEKRKP